MGPIACHIRSSFSFIQPDSGFCSWTTLLSCSCPFCSCISNPLEVGWGELGQCKYTLLEVVCLSVMPSGPWSLPSHGTFWPMETTVPTAVICHAGSGEAFPSNPAWIKFQPRTHAEYITCPMCNSSPEFNQVVYTLVTKIGPLVPVAPHL